MPVRGPLPKAGPETDTIFGHQIQSTKSEAPLWGLTFCGSELGTENGIEKWAYMTNIYETQLSAIRWKHTTSMLHTTIFEYLYATHQLSSHAMRDGPIADTL